jgi:hypothetical protein
VAPPKSPIVASWPTANSIIKRCGALAVRNTAAMARDRDDFEFFCMSAAASVEGRGAVIGLDVIVAAAGR